MVAGDTGPRLKMSTLARWYAAWRQNLLFFIHYVQDEALHGADALLLELSFNVQARLFKLSHRSALKGHSSRAGLAGSAEGRLVSTTLKHLYRLLAHLSIM